MIVRELITKLGFQVEESGIRKANGLLKELGGGVLKFFTVAGAIAGIVELGKKTIEVAANAEKIETNFGMLLKSEERAKQLMGDIGEFSKKATIPLETLQGTAEKLLRAGMSQGNIIPVMKMLGDAAGGDEQRFDQLTMSYQRMQIRGAANTKELIAMGRASGPIYAVLEKQLGVNYEQLMKLGAQGKISINEINKAFETMTGKGGMFENGMEKQALTLNGMLIILKNNFTGIFEKLGNILMPVVKEVIGMITDIMEPISNILTSVFSIVTPVLHSIFSLVSGVLKPVLPFIVQIFAALKPVTDIIIQIVDQVLSMVTGVLAGGLTERFSSLVPVIKMFVDEFAQLWTILQPVTTIMFRLVGKEMQFYSGIVSKLIGGWAWTLEKIYPVVFKITNAIIKFLVPAITWVYDKFEGIYSWMLKILHLTKKAGDDSKKMTDDLQKNTINNQKNMNLNMQNDININTPGLTPSDFQSAMGEVTRKIFTAEMKKIWQTAM